MEFLISVCFCIYRQIIPDYMFPNANQMCSTLLVREPLCENGYKSNWVSRRGNVFESCSCVAVRLLAEQHTHQCCKYLLNICIGSLSARILLLISSSLKIVQISIFSSLPDLIGEDCTPLTPPIRL